MKIKTNITIKEYQACLDWIDEQFDKVKHDSDEGRKLLAALLLIEKYEEEHYPILLPGN